MMATITDFIATILSNVISESIKKREPSEYKKEYDRIRREIAEALSMYACCFNNPVDLAQYSDHKLPPFYAEGTHRIREMAAKLSAFAETLPDGKTDVPISISEMKRAAGCLYGLSNSFCTAYGRAATMSDMEHIEKMELELRKLLRIRK